MERHELREALVELCQQYGFTTPRTYELVDETIDSIALTPEDYENATAG